MSVLQPCLVEGRRIGAFVGKGFLVMISYRFGFLLRVLYVLGLVAMFYFFGRVFGLKEVPSLAMYGGSYVSFVLIGFAFEDLYRAALSVYPNAILSEQKSGTLEYLLSTDLGIHRFLHYSSIWGYTDALIGTFMTLTIGVLVFGATLQANPISTVVIASLMLLTVGSLGVMAAGIVLVVKQGNPIDFVFQIVSMVFSGVIFPPTVLPKALQSISQILPLTHALHALRLAILQDYPLAMLLPEIKILALFAAVSTPTSILVLRWGFNRARREGSLAQF